MNAMELGATEKRIKMVRNLFFEGMTLRNKLFDESSESQYAEVEHLKYVVGTLFHLVFAVEFEQICCNEVYAAKTLEEREKANKNLRECVLHAVESIKSIEDMRQYGGFKCVGLDELEHRCYAELKDLKREYQKLLKKKQNNKVEL